MISARKLGSGTYSPVGAVGRLQLRIGEDFRAQTLGQKLGGNRGGGSHEKSEKGEKP
jgi:hypothetical protein